MAAKNAVTRGDHNGNIMIDKEHSYTNIDPMAAVINGMLFVIKKMGTQPSVYESRGMLVLE
jgi:phage terminase large subunit-like protein